MAASWQRLGAAVGCTGIGVNRVRIEPGRLSTPPHSHGASEEIVFVLGGTGFSWQDEQVYELRPGDCVVHLADHEEHTLRGGPDGLEVLICGTRHPTGIGWLPRSRAIRFGWPWVEGRTDDPWDIEAAAEPLVFGEVAARPSSIVNIDDTEVVSSAESDCEVEIRYLGREAGSVDTGMRHEVVVDGKLNCPPHCHGAEEEFFLVLDGEGTCLLGDDELLVRRGSIVGRAACVPRADHAAHVRHEGTERHLLLPALEQGRLLGRRRRRPHREHRLLGRRAPVLTRHAHGPGPETRPQRPCPGTRSQDGAQMGASKRASQRVRSCSIGSSFSSFAFNSSSSELSRSLPSPVGTNGQYAPRLKP